jgi:hypothetical protein
MYRDRCPDVVKMTYRTEQWQAESDLLGGHWTRRPSANVSRIQQTVSVSNVLRFLEYGMLDASTWFIVQTEQASVSVFNPIHEGIRGIQGSGNLA